jgi:hypothetical protein
VSLELVLLLAPAAVLFAALLLGRYPGEAVIARVRRAVAGPRRPRCAMVVRRRVAVALLPRGGRLVGSAIAARPPPACG